VSVTADGAMVELYIVADLPVRMNTFARFKRRSTTTWVFAADGELAAAHPEASGLRWHAVEKIRCGAAAVTSSKR